MCVICLLCACTRKQFFRKMWHMPSHISQWQFPILQQTYSRNNRLHCAHKKASQLIKKCPSGTLKENLGPIFVLLATISTPNNIIVLTKLIAKLWECRKEVNKKLDVVRNTSTQMIRQVIKKQRSQKNLFGGVYNSNCLISISCTPERWI